MSTIFLHIGQCGNQLGQSFWQGIEEASAASDRRLASGSLRKPLQQSAKGSRRTQTGSGGQLPRLPFSLLDGTLPCILVDTETKVVRPISRTGVLSGRIPPDFQLVERRGRGNNWAYGYYGPRHADSRPTAQVMRFGGAGEQTDLKEVIMERVRKLVEKCDRFTGSVVFHSLAGGTGSGM